MDFLTDHTRITIYNNEATKKIVWSLNVLLTRKKKFVWLLSSAENPRIFRWRHAVLRFCTAPLAILRNAVVLSLSLSSRSLFLVFGSGSIKRDLCNPRNGIILPSNNAWLCSASQFHSPICSTDWIADRWTNWTSTIESKTQDVGSVLLFICSFQDSRPPPWCRATWFRASPAWRAAETRKPAQTNRTARTASRRTLLLPGISKDEVEHKFLWRFYFHVFVLLFIILFFFIFWDSILFLIYNFNLLFYNWHVPTLPTESSC